MDITPEFIALAGVLVLVAVADYWIGSSIQGKLKR